ncbi:HNH endonuclease signature motif containing protein [Methylophaga lonarensis]|uniref:HNH endonuclease signature motif containing protein n=1 Tax=Methylophaga lonarensis TaxID=999151 RepID=UPI003D2A93EE
MKGRWIKYPQEQLAYIHANCTLPRAELTQRVNARFGTNYSVDNIKSLCTRKKWQTGRDGKFYPGQPRTPGSGAKGPNKTSFKKGNRPHNWNPIGYVRETDDGYYEIKAFDTGNSRDDYIACHRLVWQLHHGPVPDNHIIIFMDGDPSNIEIENLRCIHRGAHAIINKQQLRKVAADIRPAAVTLGELRHTIGQKAKKAPHG